MYSLFRAWCERLLRIPHEPAPPPGDESSARVFRAAPAFFKYQVVLWCIAMTAMLVIGLVVLTAINVATFAEAGLPGLVSHNFIGLLAPARTPAAVIAQIAQAARSTMLEPELQQLFVASGFETELDSSPQQAREFIGEEIARWAPIIRKIGLKLD